MFADLRRRSTCWFSQISCGNLLKTDKIINNIMDNVAGIFQSRSSHFQLLRLRANICCRSMRSTRVLPLLLIVLVVVVVTLSRANVRKIHLYLERAAAPCKLSIDQAKQQRSIELVCPILNASSAAYLKSPLSFSLSLSHSLLQNR